MSAARTRPRCVGKTVRHLRHAYACPPAEVTFGGKRLRLETRAELDEIQRKIRDRGSYPAVMAPDELDSLNEEDGSVDRRFTQEMTRGLDRYVVTVLFHHKELDAVGEFIGDAMVVEDVSEFGPGACLAAADACGGVDYAGYCDGATLTWCEGGQLRHKACDADGRTCGWQAGWPNAGRWPPRTW